MTKKLTAAINLFLQLIKFKITLLATVSTATGYLISSVKIEKKFFFATIGIFILASGSCALNQFQDRKIDALMERTKNRPIPSGKISSAKALLISVSLLFLGSLILYYGTNAFSFILGIFAAFWYNGVYTYSKRKTIFSVIIGAIIGSVPPMVGFTAAGRYLLEKEIIGLSFFLFLWQVPHFWLLALKFNEDYLKAGLPSLKKRFNDVQLNQITFLWILATAVSCLLFPLFIKIKIYAIIAILIAMIWIIWKDIKFYLSPLNKIQNLSLFKDINLFALLIMLFLSVGVIR